MAVMIPNATATRDLWSEAAATLSDKDKKSLSDGNFGKGSVAKVLEIAKQKKAESEEKQWSFSFRGKKFLVRDLLDSFLTWTKKFESAAEFVVGLDVSGHAAIPWSAIKFVLDIAGKDFEKHGAMLLGLDFVAREINFYTIFEVIYLKKPSKATKLLSQSLVETYAKLLTHLARAKRYYSDNTLKQAIKAPFNDGGVDEMMTDVGNARPVIEQNARLIDKQVVEESLKSLHGALGDLEKELEDWKVPVERTYLLVTEISDATRSAKKREILDWISPIRYTDHDDRAKDGRLQNSGQWLLDHCDFKEWKASPDSSILWLHGLPGSGKTKLSSLVVDTLRSVGDKNLDPLAYFYCARDTAEPERADPAQILKCIARQLAYNPTASTIRPAAEIKYDELTEGGIQSKQLDFKQSAELILDIAQELASATMVIDAVDECRGVDLLLEQLSWILRQSKTPLRIFIASRNERVISISLKELLCKEIEIGENSGDIDLFVRTEVDRVISRKALLFGKVSPTLKQKIVNALTSGAQGMFRWASLQLQCLTKLKKEESVMNELSKIPPELSDLYAKIYEEMSKTDTFGIAAKALRFLVCSQKPIDTGSFLTAVCPPPLKAIDSEALLDYCSYLIIEDKAACIFRFAHLSVREYLETRNDYTSIDTHTVAAELCLTCITKSRVGARGSMTAQKAETPPDAMLEYARMFWPVHCKLSGEKNRVVPPLQPPISSFIMQRRVSAKFSMWMEDARRLTKSLSMEDPLRQKLCHCFCSPPNPFFLACVFGLEEVVEHSTVPTPDRCEPGHGGLHLASMYGHDQVVRILLGKGTDVNSGDTYGRTPLFYATKHAHANVVRVLLDYDKGIEITPEILIEAAISSREKKEDKTILELLLDRAGQAYISEEIVEIAVTAPTKDMIQYLWDQDQEIHISQREFDIAASCLKAEVLEYLLDEDQLSQVKRFEVTSDTLCGIMKSYQPSLGTNVLDIVMPFYYESQIPEDVIVAAASMGDLESLNVFIKYFPNMKFSQAAFEAAAKNPNGGVEFVVFLQSRNADLQITTAFMEQATLNEDLEKALQLVRFSHNHNPGLEITNYTVTCALSRGNAILLKYLFDTFEHLKVTRVHVRQAAGTCPASVVEVLLDLNPDVQVDEELVDFAVTGDKKEVAALFLDRYKDYQVTEKILLEAAKRCRPDTLDFLLEKAPEVNITDAIIIAAINGRVANYDNPKEILELFCNKAKDFKPTEDVSIAAARSNFGREFLGFLFARYVAIPITDVVWRAATCGYDGSALDLLLRRGVKPIDLESIISLSAVRGWRPEVELLLNQAAKEIDSEKWLGITSLSAAISHRDPEKLQEVISSGVWTDTKHTELGLTPLMHAVYMGYEEIVEILLQTGKVDLEARDKDGKTALCLARDSSFHTIERMLIEKGAVRI